MKKAISTVLALGMSLSMLTACGGATSSSTAASTAASESTAASASTSAAATGTGDYAGQTLKVAAIETAYGAEMWQQIADGFEAKTGATVELTTDKNLEDVIDPQMKAGNFYDVVHLAAGREKALPETMLKENAIEEVTDVLSMNVLGEDITVGEKIIPGFTGNLTTNPYGDDRVFMMPMFYGPCGLFYNKANFTEGGGDLELPTTWDEFFALADQTDIPLFTYPVAGYLDAFTYALIAEIGGQDFFNKALQYDETVWSSPEMDKMFEILGKLAENTNDATTGYANNDNFTKNQQLILDNKALFMPNGNWVIGEMAASTPDDFEWGMMPAPKWEGDETQAVYTFTEQMWIPADAPNMDLAKEFIKFMYSDTVVDILLGNTTTDEETGEESPSPVVAPVKGAADKLPEGTTKDCYAATTADDIVTVTGKWATTAPIEGLNMNEATYKPIESINTGDMTVEEWQAQLVETWEKCAAALE